MLLLADKVASSDPAQATFPESTERTQLSRSKALQLPISLKPTDKCFLRRSWEHPPPPAGVAPTTLRGPPAASPVERLAWCELVLTQALCDVVIRDKAQDAAPEKDPLEAVITLHQHKGREQRGPTVRAESLPTARRQLQRQQEAVRVHQGGRSPPGLSGG